MRKEPTAEQRKDMSLCAIALGMFFLCVMALMFNYSAVFARWLFGILAFACAFLALLCGVRARSIHHAED